MPEPTNTKKGPGPDPAAITVALARIRIRQMIDNWQAARAELAAIERAEHPDITDHHGRVWTWWKGDLYRHCSLAWTRGMVLDGRHGLPTEKARSNPNYHLCAVCRGGEQAARQPLEPAPAKPGRPIVDVPLPPMHAGEVDGDGA